MSNNMTQHKPYRLLPIISIAFAALLSAATDGRCEAHAIAGAEALIQGDPIFLDDRSPVRLGGPCEFAGDIVIAPWDLFECLVKSRAAIRSAQLQKEAANVGIQIAKAAYWPKLNATLGRAQTINSGGGIATTSGAERYTTAAITSSYRVYDFGSTENQVKAAVEESNIAESKIEQVKNELAATILKAYFSAALQSRIRSLQARRVMLQEEFAERQSARRNSGMLTNVEVDASLISLARARQDLADAKRDDIAARLTLAELAEVDLSTIGLNSLISPILGVGVLSPVEDTIESLIANHPEVKQKSFETDRLTAIYQGTKAELYPVVDLVGTLQKNASADQRILNGGRIERTISIQMTIPLFSGMESVSRMSVARLQRDAAIAAASEIRSQMRSDIRVGIAHTKLSLVGLAARREDLSLYRKVVESASRRRRSNDGLAVDEISANISLLEAELELHHASANAMAQLCEIWRRAGVSTELLAGPSGFKRYCDGCMDPTLLH